MRDVGATPWFLGSFGPSIDPDRLPCDSRLLWDGSGKLLLSADWPAGEVYLATAHARRGSVLGTCFLPAEVLEPWLSRDLPPTAVFRAPGHYNAVFEEGPHLLVSSDVWGLRPVYYCRTEGGLLYSSSALLLRLVRGGMIDASWVATHLAAFDEGDLLWRRSPFRGVHCIPPGYFLQARPEGVRLVRYWKAPSASVSLEEGAREFREKLMAAITRRVHAVDRISSDLSGGFDSSTVAAIAADQMGRSNRVLQTVTYGLAQESRFEDTDYALQVTSSRKNIENVVLDLERLPRPFAKWEESPLADEPALGICTLARFGSVLEAVRNFASDLHLSGQGGDPVVEGPRNADLLWLAGKRRLSALLRRVATSVSLVRSSSPRLTVESLRANRMTYAGWLRREASRMAKGLSPESVGWTVPASIPPWFTPRARQGVVEMLQEAARRPHPYSDNPSQHRTVASIVATARDCRMALQLGQVFGVRIHFPYLDPEVAETCLRIEPHHKRVPGRLKPLFAAAFASELPPGFFNRHQKTSPWFFTRDLCEAAVEQMPMLRSLFHDSYLARLNLIEPATFLKTLEMLAVSEGLAFLPIVETIGTEIWLRRINDSWDVP